LPTSSFSIKHDLRQLQPQVVLHSRRSRHIERDDKKNNTSSPNVAYIPCRSPLGYRGSWENESIVDLGAEQAFVFKITSL
jgi:hypothetical protein